MKTRFISRLTALAAVMLLPLLGCGGSGDSKLTVLLKDAPGDFKAAVVTIDQVYLQGSGGKVVLSDKKVTTNLLTLANDTATLVQDAVVPAGTYSELRFVISGAYVQVDNGDGTSSIYATSANYEGLPAGAKVDGDLQTPSLDTSGLKVKLDGDKLEVTGEQKVLVVDFDVSQSFGHDAGQARKWVMHPVVKGADITLTGSAAVTLALGNGVTLPVVNNAQTTLANFNAVLTHSDGTRTVVALVDTNADGVFEANFKYLTPGTFTLSFEGPAGVTSINVAPAIPFTVNVESGKAGTYAFTLNGAVAGAQ
jgi:hypothetical protein